MQNSKNEELVYSATYVEDYLEVVENVPDEIQRLLTRLADLDIELRNVLKVSEDLTTKLRKINDKQNQLVDVSEEAYPSLRAVCCQLKEALMRSQLIADEKLSLANLISENLASHHRELDLDSKTLDVSGSGAKKPQGKLTTGDTIGANTRVEGTIQNSGTSLGTPERTVRRVRRARLVPLLSEIEKNPSKIEAPTAYLVKKSNYASNPSTPKSSASSISVMSPSVPVTSDREKSKLLAKPQSLSVSTPRTRKASGSASTTTPAVPPTPRKRSNDSESYSATTNEVSTPSTSDKKTDSGVKTPKKTFKSKAATKFYPSSASSSMKTPSKKKKPIIEEDDSSDDSLSSFEVDPNEPTYCTCNQISYGYMIGCDNDDCPIEWFHFSCVSLTCKPKGKWYCPSCRGDKSNVMKAKDAVPKEIKKYKGRKEEN